MASIQPFRALRPVPELAEITAALPYDVYNREEAKAIVEKNPKSFLRIDRPESLLPDDYDTYAPEAYIMPEIPSGEMFRQACMCRMKNHAIIFMS